MKKQQLREEWLNKLAAELAPTFKKLGHELPAYRVSVGFTSKGARSKRIGECWAKECSKDTHHEVFIHPSMSDSMRVAGIVAHELTHAAVGLQEKHAGNFKKVALALGLEGPMKSTTEGEKFIALAQPIIDKLGAYPHAELVISQGISSNGPKQSTRLIKACCAECGYTVRVTRKWLEDAGAPLCPCNQEEMSFDAE